MADETQREAEPNEEKSSEDPGRMKELLSSSPGEALTNIFNRAFDLSKPMAKKQVDGIREKYPNLSAPEVLKKLERRYLSEVTSLGAATGATAAVPGVGTVAALGTMVGDTAIFTERTATFVQAVAYALDVELADTDHERAIVMAVIFGGQGSGVASKAAERTGAHLGKKVTKACLLYTSDAADDLQPV